MSCMRGACELHATRGVLCNAGLLFGSLLLHCNLANVLASFRSLLSILRVCCSCWSALQLLLLGSTSLLAVVLLLRAPMGRTSQHQVRPQSALHAHSGSQQRQRDQHQTPTAQVRVTRHIVAPALLLHPGLLGSLSCGALCCHLPANFSPCHERP